MRADTVAVHSGEFDVQTSTAPTRQSLDQRRADGRAVPAAPLVALAGGVALVAALGPLAGGVIEYHVSDGAAVQVAGGDAAALLVVGPVLAAAAWIGRRRPTGAAFLALAGAVYVLYTYVQLAASGDVGRYDGNSERFFVLFLGLFVLAGWVTARAWRCIDAAVLPPTGRRLDRLLVGVLFTIAFFLAVGLHLPGLMDAWSAAPAAPEYLADPNVFWLVKFMDLGMVVPAIIAIGVGILRGSPSAHKAKYVAVGWLATLGTSVAGMAVLMQIENDAAASWVNTLVFGTFAVLAMALAATLYRPLTTDA